MDSVREVNGGLTMSIAEIFRNRARWPEREWTKGQQIRELLEENKPAKKSEQKTQVL